MNQGHGQTTLYVLNLHLNVWADIPEQIVYTSDEGPHCLSLTQPAVYLTHQQVVE